jgi:hypothetical protein
MLNKRLQPVAGGRGETEVRKTTKSLITDKMMRMRCTRINRIINVNIQAHLSHPSPALNFSLKVNNMYTNGGTNSFSYG